MIELLKLLIENFVLVLILTIIMWALGTAIYGKEVWLKREEGEKVE